MYKLLKHIGIWLLLLLGSIILAHAIIPHHHHYGVVKQACENEKHKTSSQTGHCDFLNELSDINIEKQGKNLQTEVVKFLIIDILYDLWDKDNHKTDFSILSEPAPENKILLTHSPPRGSPFILLV